MSPLRSSAGPADGADARRRAPRGRCTRGSSCRGRAGRQQHVVERLAARPRRLEGDRELLLDPLLADELVQTARPERPLELVLLGPHRGREELRLGSLLTPPPRAPAARAPRAAGRVDAGSACSASTSDQPSSTSASRATDVRLAGDRRRLAPIVPSFSFSSSTTRCAVFLPIPGIAWKRAVSSQRDRAAQVGGRRAGDDRQRDLRARRRRPRAGARTARARRPRANP